MIKELYLKLFNDERCRKEAQKWGPIWTIFMLLLGLTITIGTALFVSPAAMVLFKGNTLTIVISTLVGCVAYLVTYIDS